jgi:hypothetical protein
MIEIYKNSEIAFELVEADVKNVPEKTKHMYFTYDIQCVY